jgi:hypothetical protein
MTIEEKILNKLYEEFKGWEYIGGCGCCASDIDKDIFKDVAKDIALLFEPKGKK